MIKRFLPLVVVFALLVAFFVVPASAVSDGLRSIYDGNLTKQEQSKLSSIDVADVSLPSYSLWRVMPWLYEQAGIDIEFPDYNPSSWTATGCLFTWPAGGNSFQVRPFTGASVQSLYFLDQFTGLRGGTKSFQDSALTYSNFNWQIGDLFIGYYIDGDVTYDYVAMYRGQDFLEFCETGSSRNVYLSDMRDIFSRTYDCYAVIRPQLLSDEWSAVDYNDYIENLYVDGSNDIVTLDFPAYLCGTQINDIRGETYLPGQDNGMMRVSSSSFPSAGVYLPGSFMTNTVLALDNIPNGSIFTSSGSITVETWDGWTYGSDLIGGFVYFGLQFYDENFNIIGGETQIAKEFTLDIYGSEYYWEMSLVCNAPDNAKYCVYYGRIGIDEYIRNKEYTTLLFDFDMTTLQMTISSLYRQEEQSGKQNELLDQIVNGTVTPDSPAGSDSVGDLDDLESGLKDDTAAGRDEANQIFDDSFEPILGNSPGFLFWASVIDPLVSVGWIRGLLVVSLALGIFGFLANIVMVAGRSGERSSGRTGSSRGSGKGG